MTVRTKPQLEADLISYIKSAGVPSLTSGADTRAFLINCIDTIFALGPSVALGGEVIRDRHYTPGLNILAAATEIITEHIGWGLFPALRGLIILESAAVGTVDIVYKDEAANVLATDAAKAVAIGFNKLLTTVPFVNGDIHTIEITNNTASPVDVHQVIIQN